MVTVTNSSGTLLIFLFLLLNLQTNERDALEMYHKVDFGGWSPFKHNNTRRQARWTNTVNAVL